MQLGSVQVSLGHCANAWHATGKRPGELRALRQCQNCSFTTYLVRLKSYVNFNSQIEIFMKFYVRNMLYGYTEKDTRKIQEGYK